MATGIPSSDYCAEQAVRLVKDSMDGEYFELEARAVAAAQAQVWATLALALKGREQ